MAIQIFLCEHRRCCRSVFDNLISQTFFDHGYAGTLCLIGLDNFDAVHDLKRQCHDERSSALNGVFDFNVASHKIDKVFHDGKTQARATYLTFGTLLNLKESFKDGLAMLYRDSFTAIADHDFQTLALGACDLFNRASNSSVRRREFESIA
ncbi:hypothetical protein D3C72_1020740 [compost metagenome]